MTKSIRLAHNRLDLVGETFGTLFVEYCEGNRSFNSGKKSTWMCSCNCGKKVVVLGSSLTSGNTTSCGCVGLQLLKDRSSKHMKTGTRIYRIWQGMINRCRNKNQANFKNYGGRGIVVCDRWLSFDNFLSDMGEPQPNESIDRINNDGDYEPNNCRWSSRAEQSLNKRSNRVIAFNGVTKPLIEWARDLDIDQASLRERLDKWPLCRALTQPKKECSHGIA